MGHGTQDPFARIDRLLAGEGPEPFDPLDDEDEDDEQDPFARVDSLLADRREPPGPSPEEVGINPAVQGPQTPPTPPPEDTEPESMVQSIMQGIGNLRQRAAEVFSGMQQEAMKAAEDLPPDPAQQQPLGPGIPGVDAPAFDPRALELEQQFRGNVPVQPQPGAQVFPRPEDQAASELPVPMQVLPDMIQAQAPAPPPELPVPEISAAPLPESAPGFMDRERERVAQEDERQRTFRQLFAAGLGPAGQLITGAEAQFGEQNTPGMVGTVLGLPRTAAEAAFDLEPLDEGALAQRERTGSPLEQVGEFLGPAAAMAVDIALTRGALGAAAGRGGLLGRAAQSILRSGPKTAAFDEIPFVAGDVLQDRSPGEILANAAIGGTIGGTMETLIRTRRLSPDDIVDMMQRGRVGEVSTSQWRNIIDEHGTRQDVRDLIETARPDLVEELPAFERNAENLATLRTANTAIRLPDGRVIAAEGEAIQPHGTLVTDPSLQDQLDEAVPGFVVEGEFMPQAEFEARFPGAGESNALAEITGRPIGTASDLSPSGLRGFDAEAQGADINALDDVGPRVVDTKRSSFDNLVDRSGRRITEDDEVIVFHATDSETAQRMLDEGVDPSNKPSSLTRQEFEAGGPATFAPGRGLGEGVYVAGGAQDAEGFGRELLAIRVPMRLVRASAEQQNLGRADPFEALRVGDAVIEGQIPAENIARVNRSGKSGGPEFQQGVDDAVASLSGAGRGSPDQAGAVPLANRLAPDDVSLRHQLVEDFRTGDLSPEQASRAREELPWIAGAGPDDIGLPRAATNEPEVVAGREAARHTAPGEGGFLNLPEVVRGAVDVAKGVGRRLLPAPVDMPEEAFARLLGRNHAFAARTQRAVELKRDMRQALREEFGDGPVTGFFRELVGSPEMDAIARDMHRAVKGEIPFEELPARFRPIAREMRANVDLISKQLRDEGIVEGPLAASVADNMGTYLHRSYRLFKEDDFWPEQIKRINNPQTDEDLALVRAKNKIVAGIREANEGMSDEEAELMFKAIFAGDDAASRNPIAAIGRLGMGKDLSITRARRGFVPSALRDRTHEVLEEEFGPETIDAAIEAVRRGDHKDENVVKVLRELDKEVKPEKILRDFGEGWLVSPEEATKINRARREVRRQLEARFELSPEMRALMGEETDIRISYPETVAKMARFMENHKLMRDLAAMGEGSMFFGSKVDAVRAVGVGVRKIAGEASESMQPLVDLMGGELWMDSRVADAFESFYSPRVWGPGMMSGFMRNYMRINSLVKEGKTVGQVGTHARNTIGGLFFMMANGHLNLFKPMRFARDFGSAASTAAVGTEATEALAGTRAGKTVLEFLSGQVRDEDQARAYFRELQELGVVQQDAIIGELRNEMRARSANNMSSFADKAFTRSFRRIREAAQGVYMAEDDIFRILAFESELRRHAEALPDMGEEALKEIAARKTRMTYQTFELAPRWVQDLSATIPLIGTFPNFTYQMFRTAANAGKLMSEEWQDPALRHIAMQRAVGAAQAATLVPAAGQASMMMHGITKEDDNNLRNVVPAWEKDPTLIYTSPMQGGEVTYVNTGYTDPYSTLRDTPMRMFRILSEGGSFPDMMQETMASIQRTLSPFVGEEILFGAVREFWLNENEFGNKIGKGADTDIENNWLPRFQHFWERIAPGVIAEGTRIAQSLSDPERPGGFRRETSNELTALLGWRTRTMDFSRAVGFEAREKVETARDYNQVLGDRLELNGVIPEEEIEDAWSDYERRRQKVLSDLHEVALIVQKSGVARSEIVDAISGNGFSKTDAEEIVDGSFSNRVFDDRFLREMQARAEEEAQTPSERFDVQEEFARRRRILNELARGRR